MTVIDQPPKGHVRIFADMVVNIDVRLEPGSKLPDWPQNLQDKVYKEIEARSIAKGRKYKYWNSQWGVDDNVAFIHVVMYDDVPKTMLLPPSVLQ